MSVQPEHTGSGETLHPDIDGLAIGSLLSSAIKSSQCAPGEIIVVRVVGEVDLCTIPILQAALDASLDQGPAYLVVDLARMTFCSVRGLDKSDVQVHRPRQALGNISRRKDLQLGCNGFPRRA